MEHDGDTTPGTGVETAGAGASTSTPAGGARPLSPGRSLTGPEGEPDTDSRSRQIAGLSVLKGLILYGATLTFAAFYTYFMVEIAVASANDPPRFNGAMIAAAAALAGVLGSAFALFIGVPTAVVNEGLRRAVRQERDKPQKRTHLRRALSLEPATIGAPSWPLTFGIWVYAVVAGAVAIVYFLNQGETPEPIKALAVAFAGYVLALVTAAYGLASRT